MSANPSSRSPLREQRDALKSKLPRLPRVHYQGRAAVFWTHTLEHRATGWLDAAFHATFRELVLHACARHELACPAYVLMPDHAHLVWLGLSPGSDQTLATRFLRQHLAPALAPRCLQDRPHDHVLREEDRRRGAFQSAVHYIRENPVRAGLVTTWQAWLWAGALLVGYPRLDPRDECFWDDFWKLHNRRVEELHGEPSRSSRSGLPDPETQP